MGTEADFTEHKALSGGDATDDADLAQAVFLTPNEGQPAAISDITAGVRRSQPSFGPGEADRRSTKRPRWQDVPISPEPTQAATRPRTAPPVSGGRPAASAAVTDIARDYRGPQTPLKGTIVDTPHALGTASGHDDREDATRQDCLDDLPQQLKCGLRPAALLTPEATQTEGYCDSWLEASQRQEWPPTDLWTSDSDSSQEAELRITLDSTGRLNQSPSGSSQPTSTFENTTRAGIPPKTDIVHTDEAPRAGSALAPGRRSSQLGSSSGLRRARADPLASDSGPQENLPSAKRVRYGCTSLAAQDTKPGELPSVACLTRSHDQIADAN